MKTVYIVTSGEYSDYGIVAVFSQMDEATKFIEDMVLDDARVESYPVDTAATPTRQGKSFWFVQIRRDGYVENVCETTSGFNNAPSFRRYGEGKDAEAKLLIHCWAKDGQHAVKIANEKRAKFIALNLWPEPNGFPKGVWEITLGDTDMGEHK